MEILKDCYKSDKRKGFHALTFADHAIRYWDRYHDGKAKEYLIFAKQWLSAQAVSEPWLTDYERLANLVQKRLVL